MTHQPIASQASSTVVQSQFKPFPLIITVLIIMIAVSQWIAWYGNHVSIPRYCDKIEQTTAYLRQIITESTPAGNGARKPYLIASKILFIMPQQPDENTDQYLARVQNHLVGQCR